MQRQAAFEAAAQTLGQVSLYQTSRYSAMFVRQAQARCQSRGHGLHPLAKLTSFFDFPVLHSLSASSWNCC